MLNYTVYLTTASRQYHNEEIQDLRYFFIFKSDSFNGQRAEV